MRLDGKLSVREVKILWICKSLNSLINRKYTKVFKT